MKELIGVVGLGQPRVTTPAERVERSLAAAMMMDLVLLKLPEQIIPADRP